MNKTLKEKVLSMNQEYIYSLYFEIPISDINWSASRYNHKLSNPFREDADPSLSFAWFGEKLIVRDFADPTYSGDIFKVVGYIMNLNYNVPSQFVEICNNIIYRVDNKKIPKNNEYEIINKQKSITRIDIKSRTLQKRDYEYFIRYYITAKYVDKFVTPVMRYSINGFSTNYANTPRDPCYQYKVNDKYVKLYFPNRIKSSSSPRFITNNIYPFDDITDICKCNDVIIVKSIKDKMLLIQLMDELNITDICILTASSETATFTLKQINFIRTYTEYNIYSIYDTDKVGISSMNVLEIQYGVKKLIFSIDAKDPTDYAKQFGYKKTKKLFLEKIQLIIINRNL